MTNNKFPKDSIIGEEFEDKFSTNNYKWSIDPIDGTRAFVIGAPTWSNLISLSFEEKSLIGLANFPELNKYYINDKEVRARDVQTLFADLSTGAHSPSLISQGRIGQLVTSKPIERKSILEEAAGTDGARCPVPAGGCRSHAGARTPFARLGRSSIFGIFLRSPEITDQTDILDPPADRQDRRSKLPASGRKTGRAPGRFARRSWERRWG